MRPRIVVSNRGDVLLFDSEQAAESYLEPADVRNEEYMAYDTEGRLLSLRVEGNKVQIVAADLMPQHQDDLRVVLESFLMRVGDLTQEHRRLSLPQLAELILKHKTT